VLSRINFDITHGHNNWLKLGFAIASEYGERGLDYFKQLSQFHPEYDEYKTEKKYKSFLGNIDNGIRINTFYWYWHPAIKHKSKANGITWKTTA
ncbi:MAG: hypothetical protein FGM54_04485, partial [Chitinophagaceae bacterium]|nr:hypothetical protein [Chitinophagaceae bacterium]